ncbi:EGF-like domain-containing protein [Tieghemostelium lacteum]|uniref:EGF-like domain-containing protein n=1 Tax=Tieghemostelium lacteum TaxID=361077 RepID=A0A151Z3Q6_TIELA|nr:EGF-like domain-containing protein [Tieghemostelium lacteum]|eukprot:KYQ88578.1 EGF-like domain-containing protein [Tieghemostelium lacteum]
MNKVILLLFIVLLCFKLNNTATLRVAAQCPLGMFYNTQSLTCEILACVNGVSSSCPNGGCTVTNNVAACTCDTSALIDLTDVEGVIDYTTCSQTCDHATSGCGANTECTIALAGSAITCTCISGDYYPDSTNTSCSLNPCSINTNGDLCQQICTLNVTSPTNYTCSCNSGYSLVNGSQCVNIDECTSGLATCSHGCSDKIGSYVCTCEPGYQLNGDGHTCDLINCPSGFEYNTTLLMCTDIDECKLPNNCNTLPNSACSNLEGTYQCDCNQGFQKNETTGTCDNINECKNNNGGCKQLCIDTIPGFQCACSSGFVMSNTTMLCVDINECKIGNEGVCDQICVNTIGSYYCSCNIGYSLDTSNNSTCLNINECLVDNGGCQVFSNTSTCTDTIGSRFCSCPSGYTLKGETQCIDNDECSQDPCDQFCTNTPGSYYCTCAKEFVMDSNNVTCSDRDECQENTHQCKGTSVCLNTIGGYQCQCPSGWEATKDGLDCTKINRCITMNCGNSTQGSCDIEKGCICNPPFSGVDCSFVEVKEVESQPSKETPSVQFFLKSTEYKGDISIVSLQEINYKNDIIKEHPLSNWNYEELILPEKTISKYTLTIQANGYPVNLNVTITQFNQDEQVQFANNTYSMKSKTIKYGISMSEYRFKSSLNHLNLVMSGSIETSQEESCSKVDTSNKLGNEVQYVQYTVNDRTLQGRFINRAIVDGRVQVISTNIVQNNADSSYKNSRSLIQIPVPNYKQTVELDPDFSLLITSKQASSSESTEQTNTLCSNNINNKEETNSKTKLIGIIVGCVGGFIVLTVIVSAVLLKKYKHSHRVISIKKKFGI